MKSIMIVGDYGIDEVLYRDYPLGMDQPRVRKDRWIWRDNGGNAGNVASQMPLQEGWAVYPAAVLDDTPDGKQIRADLEVFGCDVRFVENRPDGGTTVCTEIHNCIKRDGSIGRSHAARDARNPKARHPHRHFHRLRDEVPALLEKMDAMGLVPDVFFFGAPAAGNRELARQLKARGTSLVYYEIQNKEEEGHALWDSLAVADVVKMPVQRVSLEMAEAFVKREPGKLYVHTLQGDGVRFRMPGGDWIQLPALPANLVDSEGAGDAMTVGFLGALPTLKVGELTEAQVRAALDAGQRLAVKAIGDYGTKGYIYNDPKYAAIAQAVKSHPLPPAP